MKERYCREKPLYGRKKRETETETETATCKKDREN